MTHLTVDVVHSIEQVDRAEWDDLCIDHEFVSHRWLRLAESVLSQHEPRYVLVRRRGRLEAAAVYSVARRFGHHALQRRLGWVLRVFPWVRCIAPLSSAPGLLVRTDVDADRMMPTLVRAVRQGARRERALFITCGLFAVRDPVWPEVQQAGFQPHARLTQVRLPIAWSSVEDYLASLPGTHRRKIGKLDRRAVREGIAVERLPIRRADPVHLRALISQVLERHGSSDLYAPDLLERVAAICGPDLHILAARRAGDVIGCVVAVRDRDALLAKWIGLDYGRCWGTATYRVLLAETVHLAIDLRVRSLALGPTAVETKLDLGGVAEERVGALEIVPPIPASVVTRAAHALAGRAASDPAYSSASSAG